MLEDGVARLAVVCARGGDASVRAVEHAQVLAPCAGRLGFSCGVRAPVAHDLPGDATLQRQDAASSDLFFRKLVLLVKQVERRKGKRGGGTGLRVIGTGGSRRGVRRGLDAFVLLNQAPVRGLEFDERVRRPGAVSVEALVLTNPVTHVCALRQPSDKRARGGIEGRQARGALRRQAEPSLEMGQLDPHAVPVRHRRCPRGGAVARALGQYLVGHSIVHCLHTACLIRHGGGWKIPAEMRKPSVVTEADQLEVDTRVSEELKLFDVLHHCLGLLLHKCLHERRRANGHADANHALNLHDVLGGVVVDSEDVLEAVERLVRFHEEIGRASCRERV